MKDLTSFIQDKTKLEYKIGGKVIIGDVSAMKLLELQANKELPKLDEAEANKVLLEHIFGKENAKVLLTLTIEALAGVLEDVAACFGTTEQKK